MALNSTTSTGTATSRAVRTVQEHKGASIASAAATVVAGYLAWRVFRKQKGALEGLFTSVGKKLTR